jgi:hypothetical protein
MKHLTWLASYPKSGNTWVRAFLLNYIQNKTEPAHINNLTLAPIASDRAMFDQAVGLEASNLTADEIDLYRSQVATWIAREVSKPFFKIHDAFWSATGVSIIPTGPENQAIYIVRHPFDVAISYARSVDISLDEAIAFMCGNKAGLSKHTDHIGIQFRQHLGTWSEHVLSWLDQSLVKVQMIRYEDLLTDAENTFRQLLQFSGIDVVDERLKRAVRFSSFKTLKSQEQKDGFKERRPKSTAFFRKGVAGEGRQTLSPEQQKMLLAAHSDVMRRLGYLRDE